MTQYWCGNLLPKKFVPQSITKPNQADIICMRELLMRDEKWEFYLNPASSELPLMAVGEIEELVRERESQSKVCNVEDFRL